MSLYEELDSYAISRGHAQSSIQLNQKAYIWTYLIEGLIVGSPIFFRDNNDCPVILCRLSHLKIGNSERASLQKALSESFKLWRGIPVDANVHLSNPTFIMTASEDDSESAQKTMFTSCQKCLDQLFISNSAISLYSPSLLNSNNLAKTASGALRKPTGEIIPMRPIATPMPPAILKAYEVDASISFKESPSVSSIERAYLNAISWLRQGKLENNVVSKFMAYWLAFESCFPENVYKKKDLLSNLALFFGFFRDKHRYLLDPKEKGMVDSLPPNSNEIRAVFDSIYDLRVNLFHYGSTELTMASSRSDEYAFAAYFLRHEVLGRCLWLLRDTIEQGMTHLEKVWPERAVHFVLSDRYRKREDSFCQSLFKYVKREDVTAENVGRHFV